MTDPLLVADLSESQLLSRIFPLLPHGQATIVGPGDDAAVVRAPDGRFVVSTDVLVENHHFRRAWSSGYDVGWRAAMQNLADCAAMGARTTSLVVALVIPPSLEVEWVTDLARGLADACALHGAAVVGGDLSGGENVVVAVTVHGDLEGRGPVLRSGARPGDVLAHAGVLGRSAAGLALLEADRSAVSPGLVESFLRPAPPLDSGVDAAVAGATAMLDVSDGLLRDAGRIAAASGVVLDLEDPYVVLAGDVAALQPACEELGTDPLSWLLTGGEDHGMLATFPEGVQLPQGFRAIGRVKGTVVETSDRQTWTGSIPESPMTVMVCGAAPTVDGPGWDHFAG
ncbi:thiamine-phosphate kinase [Sanguibacter antarcticus]|uniref:Thiamine-monophosphate kinase n=1 Tax=Sanguibacter antarcticus TaxID=372484 RepID=A0A2A9E3A5_9MICO|nr:thiamine-phosphate kinase [Sanguibacter antarcticus]PFG32712.1 thiamine-phosphate kinase [Sanguibacter antarcticus]